jgi:hypothetical protein
MEPLSATEWLVMDAALIEDLAEELGLLDDPSFLQRYRAQRGASRSTSTPPGESRV